MAPIHPRHRAPLPRLSSLPFASILLPSTHSTPALPLPFFCTHHLIHITLHNFFITLVYFILSGIFLDLSSFLSLRLPPLSYFPSAYTVFVLVCRLLLSPIPVPPFFLISHSLLIVVSTIHPHQHTPIHLPSALSSVS